MNNMHVSEPTVTRAPEPDWSDWENWLRSHLEIQREVLTEAFGEALGLTCQELRDRISALELKLAELTGAADILRGTGAVFDWELVDGNKLITVKTSGTALVTDITEALNLALAGIGIAYVVDLLARPYLRDGSLKWLLPQAAVEQEGAFLYYPRRASLAPKLRAFIDVAKKTLKSFE
jgi:DNA-binding transcriptional LysR family regulator